MKVIRTIAEVRAALAGAARPVGLVPTMGFFHDGHLSLMRAARGANATVVLSLFRGHLYSYTGLIHRYLMDGDQIHPAVPDQNCPSDTHQPPSTANTWPVTNFESSDMK